MCWYGVTLIFQCDGCAALYIWRETGEVTPTEDDYVDGTTSTKEYMPRTCCVATVKILGESCRVAQMDVYINIEGTHAHCCVCNLYNGGWLV